LPWGCKKRVAQQQQQQLCALTEAARTAFIFIIVCICVLSARVYMCTLSAAAFSTHTTYFNFPLKFSSCHHAALLLDSLNAFLMRRERERSACICFLQNFYAHGTQQRGKKSTRGGYTNFGFERLCNKIIIISAYLIDEKISKDIKKAFIVLAKALVNECNYSF
jgi:hypothetical protein